MNDCEKQRERLIKELKDSISKLLNLMNDDKLINKFYPVDKKKAVH